MKDRLGKYFWFYNTARLHQSLDYQVPDEKYESFQTEHQELALAS